MYWRSLCSLLLIGLSLKAQVPDFTAYPVYEGKDLGLTYTKAASFFRVWSPPASELKLLLYTAGSGGEVLGEYNMQKDVSGTWVYSLKGDFKGRYYAFKALINGKWSNEVPDPYARLVGTNGKRGMIDALSNAQPEGWLTDRAPAMGTKTSAIIYELHVRDASIHASSGIKNKGHFLGLTEKGAKNPAGQSTGLDHLKDLGVTHIHLLPSYDFYSVNEARPDSMQYNWGYDPLNYNTPEGSYSTNPEDGKVRVREFRQLIQAFHRNGLRMIMDVVYNHTMFGRESSFDQLVPGYYYRQDAKGGFSNATACGNETASERPMMRKFILESMLFWVKEYHVDGFRMDLMGVHDIETVNLISRELHKIRPDIILYGEGWTAGASPLPDAQRALKANAAKLDRVAVFSDDLRDGIKGSVFINDEKGFASGKPGMEETIKFGVVASLPHPQVDYTKINYSKAPYAAQPWNTISYCECHDNHVLWDKLAISASEADRNTRQQMHQLALSIVLTSQGISFLHAGTEFLRSKNGVENSFNAGDAVNAIDWNLKKQHYDVFLYVKSLIAMRKAHPAFRLNTAQQVSNLIRFDGNLPAGVVAYTIDGAKAGDRWKKIRVYYNGSGTAVQLPLEGSWSVFSEGNSIMANLGLRKQVVPLKPYSCTILYQQ